MTKVSIPDANAPDELVPDPKVAKEFGISAMGIWRWERDPNLGFDPAVNLKLLSKAWSSGQCANVRRCVMKAQLPRIVPSGGVLVWEVAKSAESTDRRVPSIGSPKCSRCCKAASLTNWSRTFVSTACANRITLLEGQVLDGRNRQRAC
jgi:hypothetical protein